MENYPNIYYILPIPIAVFVSIILGLLYGFLSEAKEKGRFSGRETLIGFFSVLAMSTLSAVIGFLAGSSEEAIYGALLPAVLSFVGGVSVFLIGRREESPILVGLMLFGFSTTLLIGGKIGADLRDFSVTFRQEERLNQLTNVRYQIEIANRLEKIKNYRESRGLPPEPFIAD